MAMGDKLFTKFYALYMCVCVYNVAFGVPLFPN